VYDPDGQQRRERYDKMHLVPFGELVPFRNTRLHFLYRWLNRMSPFSDGGKVDYSLTPGDRKTVFEMEVEGRTYRFGTPICYEDTTPYLVREYVWSGGERRVDFLLNISNDGWFLHSHELPQHLAICVFRAVENRVSIARAVNTGISGFIDPDGRIYARVTDEAGRSFRYGEGGVVGYAVEPIYLDPRGSVYGRIGDTFAWVCVGLSALLWLSGVFERWVLNLKHQIDRRRQRRATRATDRAGSQPG
jgi:apolipoprotein N-acyltransferase